MFLTDAYILLESPSHIQTNNPTHRRRDTGLPCQPYYFPAISQSAVRGPGWTWRQVYRDENQKQRKFSSTYKSFVHFHHMSAIGACPHFFGTIKFTEAGKEIFFYILQMKKSIVQASIAIVTKPHQCIFLVSRSF